MTMYAGWVYPDNCGHDCCDIQTNEQHSHRNLPDDCGNCASTQVLPYLQGEEEE